MHPHCTTKVQFEYHIGLCIRCSKSLDEIEAMLTAEETDETHFEEVFADSGYARKIGMWVGVLYPGDVNYRPCQGPKDAEHEGQAMFLHMVYGHHHY